MKHKPIRSILLVAMLLLLAACGGGSNESASSGSSSSSSSSGGSSSGSEAPAASKPNTLSAIKVDKISSDASAGFWSNAPKLTTITEAAIEGEPNGPDMTLQAAYDGNQIAIRVEWADATESVLKKGWTWDGSAFEKSGDEDRLMFAFPIGNNAEFASKGCTAACHNMADNPDEWWMGSESPDVLYDAWHWKAARTHPVAQVDDKWWGTQEDPTDPESSRHGDAKESGGQTANANDAGDGPAFMHGSDLKSSFIFAGEEVALDTSKLEAGMVVPGYIVSKLVGSRGDIAANGSWQNGKWIVVLTRDLDTGNDDDAVFNPPKPIPFGLSVIDNGGGLDHTNAPDVLTLEWQ